MSHTPFKFHRPDLAKGHSEANQAHGPQLPIQVLQVVT
jgi:hypothetical protein